MEAQGFLGNFGQSSFQTLLDGIGIGLELPATERVSVVGDGQFEAHGQFLLNSLHFKRRVWGRKGSVVPSAHWVFRGPRDN